MPAMDAAETRVTERNELPEEIFWIRVGVPEIEGVQVRSQVLVSLPSVAKFLGIRSDAFGAWIVSTTFADTVLSIHHQRLGTPQIHGVWKRGFRNVHTPFIPFEL